MKGLGLEQKVTEAVIERVDEELVEKYCVGKYARGNSKKRYQRAGSVERHPVASVGRLNLRLHRVRDKEKEKTTPSPSSIPELSADTQPP